MQPYIFRVENSAAFYTGYTVQYKCITLTNFSYWWRLSR